MIYIFTYISRTYISSRHKDDFISINDAIHSKTSTYAEAVTSVTLWPSDFLSFVTSVTSVAPVTSFTCRLLLCVVAREEAGPPDSHQDCSGEQPRHLRALLQHQPSLHCLQLRVTRVRTDITVFQGKDVSMSPCLHVMWLSGEAVAVNAL